MTIILIILLSVSVFMILFGHIILSVIDKRLVYPKRIAQVQPSIPKLSSCSSPPDTLPPAIVSMLWGLRYLRHPKKPRRSTRFTVTLLDLIHRGIVKVVRDGKKLYLIPTDVSDDTLRPYERILLDFVKDAARSTDRLSVAKLKGYIEEHRESAVVMRKRFLQELVSEFESYGYYGVQKCKSAFHPLALIGGISVLASLGAFLGWICSNIPLGVITACFAGFAGWLSVQVFTYDLTFLTDKGAAAMGAWESYNQHIHALKTEEAPIQDWHRIAVYAAAMEGNLTFHDLIKIWKKLPEFSLECELYDPYFYKKLSEIDYAILISNAENIDSDLFRLH